MMWPHGHHGGCLAAPQGGREAHAHLARVSPISQRLVQCACARQLARKRVTRPQSYLRRWGLFIMNDVEMGVESRRFIDGGHGQVHESGKGPKAGHGEVTVCVLQYMQVLDKAIAVPQ